MELDEKMKPNVRLKMKDQIMSVKDAIALTLQATISQLGFMSDNHGTMVKEILAKDDFVMIAALGCHLDECREEKNYNSLDRLSRFMSEVDK